MLSNIKNTQNSFQIIWCFQVVFLQHAVFCFPKKTKAIGLAPNSSAKDHPNSLPYLHQNHGFPWWFWCNKNKQNHSHLAKTRLQIHTETTKTAYNIHKFGDSMCFPTLELFELLTFPPKKIKKNITKDLTQYSDCMSWLQISKTQHLLTLARSKNPIPKVNKNLFTGPIYSTSFSTNFCP